MSLANRVSRTPFPLTFPNPGTTVSFGRTSVNGFLRGATVVAPALDGAATLTLTLTDYDGTVLYSKAGISGNAKTFLMLDANNVPLQVPLSGVVDVTLTASGSQTSQPTVTVNLLISK